MFGGSMADVVQFQARGSAPVVDDELDGLLKAYSRIKDADVRRALVDLVKRIAEDQD